MNSAALDPDPVSLIGRRTVASEPMYLILNLGEVLLPLKSSLSFFSLF